MIKHIVIVLITIILLCPFISCTKAEEEGYYVREDNELYSDEQPLQPYQLLSYGLFSLKKP